MADPWHPEPSGHRDAVFGLCERDAKVLLVLNDRISSGGLTPWWDLPGGAARPGERLPAALEREWHEETGLPARVVDLLFVVDGAKRRETCAQPLYTWRAFAFRVASEGTPRPGTGIHEAAWLPRAEAAARLTAPYHEPLRAWLRGEHVSYRTVDWIEPGPGREPPVSRLRPLLVLAAAAAVGDGDLVESAAREALEQGLARERIEEALLQTVPYAGFPRAIAALSAARPILGPQATGAPEHADRATLGWDTFSRVYGETAPRVREALTSLHPLLATWTMEEAYGRVLSRPALPLLERELLAVSILTALGGLDDPLLGHARAALRLGASAADVSAAVEVVPASVGEGRKDQARRLLARV